MQTCLNRRTPNTDYEAVDFSKYKAHRIIVCKLVIVRVEYRRVRRMLVLQYGSDATVLADRMHIVRDAFQLYAMNRTLVYYRVAT